MILEQPSRLGNRWGAHLALTATLVALVVLAFHGYRSVERELTDAAVSRRVSISYLAAATLSEKFERLIDLGISLATRVRFRELIGAGNWADASEILRSIPTDFPSIDRVFLADVQGTLMADIPALPGVRGKNFAYRDWYQGVTAKWEPYVSPVYTRAAAPQLNVFAVAVPIRSRDDRALGILVLQVRLETFFEWTRGIDIGAGGLVYVVDSKGQVAFHPQLPPQGKTANLSGVPLVQRLLGGETGVEIMPSPFEREESISAFVPSRYGWGVVTQQPTSAAFATRDAQLRRVLSASALLLLAFLTVVYLVIRLVIRRREALEAGRVQADLERRVAERTAELQGANKELESFSYSVSHDLRAPLRAIDGFSRMLEEDYGERLDGEGRRLLGVVRESTASMDRLIDDLLEFARVGRQQLARTTIEMTPLAREAAAEIVAAGEQPQPAIEFGSLPSARGDRSLLRQVWSNLIGNAVKYSAKRERPAIEVGGRAEAERAVYWVKDNGAGFDMRYYDKLFGVFQRLHQQEEFSGTGVGLAIVQRVIARHGGEVWAEGQLDAGASFYFSLPARRNDGE